MSDNLTNEEISLRLMIHDQMSVAYDKLKQAQELVQKSLKDSLEIEDYEAVIKLTELKLTLSKILTYAD